MATAKQLPGFENVRPPIPTRSTEHVAKRIAEVIVNEVNLDDFYWTQAEKVCRVWEMQQVLMTGCSPWHLMRALAQKYPVWRASDWEGIREHGEHIAAKVVNEEVDKARLEWRERYNVR